MARGERIAGAFLALAAVFAAAATVKVLAIQDGDTLTVLRGSEQVRVRSVNIDAPPSRQDLGTRSKESLAALCHGKAAELAARGTDRYGRVLAQGTCAGVDANAEQVRRGMAGVFVRYAPSGSPLYAIESKARAARRGLWSHPGPVLLPWEWRGSNRKRYSSRVMLVSFYEKAGESVHP